MTDLLTLSLLVLFLLFLATPQVLWKYLYPVIGLIAIPLHILLTGLTKFLNNIPKIVAFIILSLIGLAIVFFTSIVHWLGRFRTEDAIAELFERSIGHDNIIRVRKDILSVLPDEEETAQQTELSELSALRENAKSRMQSGELIFTILVGILFIFIPSDTGIELIFNISVNTVVQLSIMFLTLAILVRVYLINVLSFSSVDEAKEFGVETSIAWQKAICKTSISVAAIILSFFIKAHETSYQKGLEILELYLEEEVSLVTSVIRVHFD